MYCKSIEAHGLAQTMHKSNDISILFSPKPPKEKKRKGEGCGVGGQESGPGRGEPRAGTPPICSSRRRMWPLWTPLEVGEAPEGHKTNTEECMTCI